MVFYGKAMTEYDVSTALANKTKKKYFLNIMSLSEQAMGPHQWKTSSQASTLCLSQNFAHRLTYSQG